MPDVFRYRVRFGKDGLARFLSHRDLLRAFQRAARRAGLPLALTRGFHPHPRLAVPAALALGVEARNEALEIDLDRPADPADLARRLRGVLPPGLPVHGAEPLPSGRRLPVVRTRWEVRGLPWDRSQAEARLASFLRRPPAVASWIEDPWAGPGRAGFALDPRRQGGPKPREAAEALAGAALPETAVLVRTDVAFAQPSEAPA